VNGWQDESDVMTVSIPNPQAANRRYDFPIPYGWYQVAYASDLEPGQSKALRYFGQDMVLFRGETGKVQVLDAYCPHLGAHLGYGIHDAEGGGKVQGDTIICPFHGWRFDTEGTVVEIPYAERIPPRVDNKQCLKSWPTVERNQLIWVWYHPRGEDPLWDVESIEEADNEESGWSRLSEARSKRWEIPTIPQEIAENAVDFAHFIFVHQVKSDPSAETVYDGHRGARMVRADMQTPKGVVEGGIESVNIGPGQSWIRFTGIADTLLFGNLTPVDEENVEVNFSFLQPLVDGKEPEGGVHDAIVADICKQLDEDYVIWKHKVYRDKPALCDGDGPIAQFRRYYSQFYEQ
jgi:phenylpropionate dioxygenase-like ring-hydroxylating dioxygenase large terminal subunit